MKLFIIILGIIFIGWCVGVLNINFPYSLIAFGIISGIWVLGVCLIWE